MIGHDKENAMPHHPEMLDPELSAMTGWDFRRPPWGRVTVLSGSREQSLKLTQWWRWWLLLNIPALAQFPSCLAVEWNDVNSSGSRCDLSHFGVEAFKNWYVNLQLFLPLSRHLWRNGDRRNSWVTTWRIMPYRITQTCNFGISKRGTFMC